MIVVIPTNRKIELEYLSPLIDAGARFIVIDDSEGSIRIDHPSFKVYNWNHRKSILGKMDQYFPRKNGACKDFGFYLAWHNSDPSEIIISLDDDCRVYHPDFPAQVEKILSNEARPVLTTQGKHVNVLDLYSQKDAHLYPRGYPYGERLNDSGPEFLRNESRPVTFSLGLWRGVFDVNAVDKLNGTAYDYPEATLHHPSVIIEKGKLISVCAMNMHFRRECIPAIYQFPMHYQVMPHWVIDRIGDIWGGFFLKILMDLKGEALAAGEPMIYHLKEGNLHRNIWQEQISNMVNDEMIQLLLRSSESIRPSGYLDMISQLVDNLDHLRPEASPLMHNYLGHLCICLRTWVDALTLRHS